MKNLLRWVFVRPPRPRKLSLTVLEWRMLTLKYMEMCAERLSDPEDGELVREAMDIIETSLLVSEVTP